MSMLSCMFVFFSVVCWICLHECIKVDEESKDVEIQEIKIRYFIMGMCTAFMIVLNIIVIRNV
ncbi:hypothetical protein [Clostridium baratii]|uniref:hypothetical protein n=1 Tax=Clostridium baratii TaxID=1561 RepID=UPI0030D19133